MIGGTTMDRLKGRIALVTGSVAPLHSQSRGIMERKKWQDFTPAQRKVLTGGAAMQLVLLGAALLDIRRRSSHELRGGKRVWVPAVFINFIGPIAYFLFGRKR
jgi:hypothetical protein